ncbi:hypothetical protein D6764_03785 [Candidatus Woesearchaeota archaeon]|nr:MAG: hypothetical protein D6764_03785 [Candidatus Woesearchaeota archaeon]
MENRMTGQRGKNMKRHSGRKEFARGLFLLLILSAAAVIASEAASAESVIVNSKDWRDVYAGLQYAKLNGQTAYFVKSESHAVSLLNFLNNDEKYVVLNGAESFLPDYESLLKGKGLDAEALPYDNNLNIELARKLRDEKGIKKYIIVDDSMGYNAISVAPYAKVSESYVLFANAATIDDIISFFREERPESVTIYGHVRREVKEALQEFNPEEINEGNRFANNREIVRRYLKINPINQTLLTNGEFIEDELMEGKNPIVFIGRNNIPDETKEFIKEAGFKYAVLIGNNLIPTATYVKRRLDIAVFVKFAKGLAGTGNPSLQDLDTFPVPRYAIALDIKSVKYNVLTNTLEVTYQNLLESPAYAKTTITLLDSNKTASDKEAVFLDGFQEKTVAYPLELDEAEKNNPGIASAIMLYGEDEGSLEFVLQKNMTVSTLKVLDNSQAEIIDAYYDVSNAAFIITIQNTGSTDVFANAEIIGLMVDGEQKNIAGNKNVRVKPGEEGQIAVRQRMTELDLADNPSIKVRVYYGEREEGLIKQKEKEFPLKVKKSNLLVIIGASAAVAVLVLWLIFGKRRKRKEE